VVRKDEKWLMTLATKDRVTFYSSPDLKIWTKESEFGENVGSHGGVWECPDLFPLEVNGKTEWVLLVSINPGGPNGGSATQYFTGNFDGSRFTPIAHKHNGWIGVQIIMQVSHGLTLVVPTDPWRSAMTIPRQLSLNKIDSTFYLSSMPVPELNSIVSVTKAIPFSDLRGAGLDLSIHAKDF
jgi:fructan beta-fructosidase